MTRVTLRPTVLADVVELLGQAPPHRIQAITAELDGKVVGVGGIGFRPDGVVIAFADFAPEMRRHPAAVHRAGVAGMALIRASGVRTVVAEAQPGNPAAERWLERFGFEPFEFCGQRAYVWRRPDVE